jgi:uncharacterized DUF497 family protein
MKFSWDENKRKANLAKHGLDFADVFAGATFTFEDGRFDYGEERFITVGMLHGRVVVLIHTERRNSIHLISMRKATKHEQEIYFKGFSN